MKGSLPTSALRLLSCQALLAAALLTTGCGGSSRVQGKVTLNGAPARGVTITFLGAGRDQKTATTDGAGEFRLDNPPVGSVKVTVKNLRTELPMPAAIPAGKGADKLPRISAPESAAVPAKYADANTSGLATTLHKGKNTFNIALE